MSLISYQEVLESLKKKRRIKHLLLGNGFSMSYDREIFSYNALSTFVEKTEDDLLKKLFRIIGTNNFELIMSELDTFYKLADEFLEDKKLSKRILNAREALQKNLIDAISELHPEHVFNIPEDEGKNCARFLKEYLDNGGHVFTTNYDLLLYWVLMRNQDFLTNFVDGFGREYIDQEEFSKYFSPEFGDLEWGPHKEEQHIHYVHGALHLFDAGPFIIKEEYDGEYLLTNIKKRIAEKEYPIFVTGGDGVQKLTQIKHNPYLLYCYNKLLTISGSLIAFGFNFGEYDNHIINAINKAATQEPENRLWSVYIGVYSEKALEHIESIKTQFKCKVNLFDAKTVNVWGDK